jgi:septal ring factor EnvC (AmiA/AmiB activator)
VTPPTPPRRLRNGYITGSTIKPFYFPHSEQTTREREDEERRVHQARWEAAERERQAADRMRVAEEQRQRHYYASTTSTTTTTTTSTTTHPPRRQIAATYACGLNSLKIVLQYSKGTVGPVISRYT